MKRAETTARYPWGPEKVNGYLFEVDGVELVVHLAEVTWTVTEPQTGLAVTRHHPTRKDAIAAAERVIAWHGGRDWVETRIRNVLSELEAKEAA